MAEGGIVVAIDGPAGSGKSTTARAVAQQLGYIYLDTGAMYRALGLAVLRSGHDPDDAATAASVARDIQIAFKQGIQGQRVLLDGSDVSVDIRAPAASDAASRVAVHEGVRQVLVARQQEIGQDGGIVLEGRDTGTVVFPDAQLKVFLSADVSERARRRQRELTDRGQDASLAQIESEIRARDARDRQTQLRYGPWPPADAVPVDTTGQTIEEQVASVVALARSREEPANGG